MSKKIIPIRKSIWQKIRDLISSERNLASRYFERLTPPEPEHKEEPKQAKVISIKGPKK
jgi:hypothetical protein